MKVMVTGATGFIGNHVVKKLLTKNHHVITVARNIDKAKSMSWFDQVDFIQCDLQKEFQPCLKSEYIPDVLVHLAWPGLPNFKSYFHINENLTANLKFLHAVVLAGVKRLMVAGTCLEYGMQSGPLSEAMPTEPSTPYGLAKDVLRKSLQLLQKEKVFSLQWARLFYMYGDGQQDKSILRQLDRAIDEGSDVFNMSEGNQLRDYLPVEKVAEKFVHLVENPSCDGVINCCSGKPTSIIDLVTQRCRERKSSIKLNRGFYPYPDYEPMAFWGVSDKLK